MFGLYLYLLLYCLRTPFEECKKASCLCHVVVVERRGAGATHVAEV